MTAALARGKGAGFRKIALKRSLNLANPELGSKQICPTCQAKFYDLGRRPAVCPKCHSEFDPDEAVRTRRVRARAVVADVDEEHEDKVVVAEAEDQEEEEEDIGAPEIDAPVDDPVLTADDEDDAEPGVAPVVEDELSEFTDDEDLEDDADVPFLEDDEDDDFDDSEIEGLPGEDDDR